MTEENLPFQSQAYRIGDELFIELSFLHIKGI